MPRLAILNKDKCVIDKECNFLCRHYCPEVRMGKEAIIRGQDNKPIIVEELCTGCGICVKRCPTKAIQIINLPEELNQTAIHRFGKNGFKLFSLPVPRQDAIVGIIGRNGIGKSTSIKILSGLLVANFENDEITRDKSYEMLIDRYKGNETQNYFKLLKENKIKIAYKPQEIEHLPKITKGKVIELLKKITGDEKKIKSIAKDLAIEHILDREIEVLSGGELQKVAICATMLKEANIFFFDEPSSFLDIEERLRISKVFRKMIKNQEQEKDKKDKEIKINNMEKNLDIKSVMVIEHDLLALDYMSDYIYVLYGKPSAYGVCSQLKSTNNGINEYLEGILKNENIRIREKPIKFGIKTHSKEAKTQPIVEWTDLEINLGEFKLTASQGKITKHKITAIIGKNGIGKTTFLKALAKEIKPKKGEIIGKVKIAYKPQHIPRKDVLVREILHDALIEFKEIIKQFEIEDLLEKNVKFLSGGELQKVAIIECITKEADIYLLDEPSSFLDIEERLRLYRLIRSLIYDRDKTAVIIDHDLLFVDYIADEVLVFTGSVGKQGKINGPFLLEEGMNLFLKELNITTRRDMISKRPRINKPNSQLDIKQKSENKWYGV